MRVYILQRLTKGPAGGGNQFLVALAEELKARGVYAESLDHADVVIINSFHQSQPGIVRRLRDAKNANPTLAIVHRVDGPFSVVRGFRDLSDDALNRMNKLVADGTVFQTQWSETETRRLGLETPEPRTTITNAPNPVEFYDDGRERLGGPKVRLVASSWSKNSNKGFDVYEWMDKHLDWDFFEMSFFGNSPFKFHNIKAHEPLGRLDLASQLRSHDIFVSAARNEPCSNALVEALHCGLPSIGFDGGGTPEVLYRGGELYRETSEIPGLIEKIVLDYSSYRAGAQRPSLGEVADKYLEFCALVLGVTSRKIISRADVLRFELEYESFFFRIRRRLIAHSGRDKRSPTIR